MSRSSLKPIKNSNHLHKPILAEAQSCESLEGRLSHRQTPTGSQKYTLTWDQDSETSTSCTSVSLFSLPLTSFHQLTVLICSLHPACVFLHCCDENYKGLKFPLHLKNCGEKQCRWGLSSVMSREHSRTVLKNHEITLKSISRKHLPGKLTVA